MLTALHFHPLRPPRHHRPHQSLLHSSPNLALHPLPLGEGQFGQSLYHISTFCPQCTLNRTFIAPNGHLQESSSGTSIVFEVPNPKQAKLVEDVGQIKQTTDSALLWKEPGAVVGGFGGGWDEHAADAGAAGGDWGDAPTETAGGDWTATSMTATFTNGGDGLSPKDSAFDELSEVGGGESWADAGEKQAKEQEEAGHNFGVQEIPMVW
ncbi:hypothetical protein D6D01_09050 [Aureobasidium pullulans]|uniref:Uncharacterized protein n=1 Tax=Aureobasidium pullulans TaxID=5580 RepID=A0A4S9K7G0_AURPU|nr:hypothetical protein D6D01_09050 [Aureobasidium pullulans]